MFKNTNVVVGVHDGVFHGDDVTAVAMLKIAFGSDNVKVIRTRNLEILKNQCDFIIDVGRRREVVEDDLRMQVWLDHHQDTCYYNNGVARAACGYLFDWLVENEYLTLTDAEAMEFRHSVLFPVEAQDNGQVVNELRCNLMSFVKALNPSWTISSNGDAEFAYAVSVAVEILKSVLTDIKAVSLRNDIVEKAISKAKETEDNIIVLEMFCRSWQTPVVWYNTHETTEKKIKMCAWYDSRAKNWRAQVVPIYNGSTESFVSYPEEVRGKNPEEINAFFGTTSAVFVHPAGFIAGFDTYDDLMKALRKFVS